MKTVRKYRLIRILALLGSIIIATQIAFSWVTGSSYCPNDGCEVVEQLTAVPPLYINILGLIFFLLIVLFARPPKMSAPPRLGLLSVILVAGLAFETALFSYQILIAQTLCSYCLVILTLVVMMNLLYGIRQTMAGAAIFTAILIAFSVLTFLPAGADSRAYSLKNAAYGKKSCSTPTKEIYLIFSADCPHCQNVLDTLNNCNSCDLYLNPIEKIGSVDLPELNLNADFSPQINRLVLRVLGIDSVPVLLARDSESYRIIKGERKIINFISQACFTQKEVLYFDKLFQSTTQDITAFTEEGSECTVEIDCPPE
jgi:hypothetical protein